MDKFILITGGTKGIGKAVASCLGKAGYNLILTYASDQAAAEEVRSELVGRFDIQVSILRADISDRNTIGVIDSFLEENRLRLDGLVFNAGMTCRDPFEELSFEDWERVFFANIHFPVFLLQKIVGRINKGGSIVFTGSLIQDCRNIQLSVCSSRFQVQAVVSLPQPRQGLSMLQDMFEEDCAVLWNTDLSYE